MSKTNTYHYTDGKTWIPFYLDFEDTPKWNAFCARVAQDHPDDPRPYYFDYLRFLEELKSWTDGKI